MDCLKDGVFLGILFDYFVIIWGFLLIGTLAIGGYFMFRKFLKQLPKEDGKSDMDWQNYYIEKTKHMWQDEELKLLEELVAPVPELFRDVAKQTIAGKIGELALVENAEVITQDLLIKGYIIGTPKRDHRFLRKKLAEKNIDVAKFEPYFKLSKKDYRDNWKDKYNELKQHES